MMEKISRYIGYGSSLVLIISGLIMEIYHFSIISNDLKRGYKNFGDEMPINGFGLIFIGLVILVLTKINSNELKGRKK